MLINLHHPHHIYGTNDNFTLDQVSRFFAGGFGDHFGSFAQFTYDGVGGSFSWDNLDPRAADRITLFGQSAVIGLSVNNNPGIQDPWNTDFRNAVGTNPDDGIGVLANAAPFFPVGYEERDQEQN